MSKKRILSIGGTTSAEEHEKNYQRWELQRKKDREEREEFYNTHGYYPFVFWTGEAGMKLFSEALDKSIKEELKNYKITENDSNNK